jgi:DNA N-6-adenine-methyltransferase (Dam)
MSLLGYMPQVGASDDWLTDPLIIERLGPFDLDPACPETMPWKTAQTMWTRSDGALGRAWSGFVWMNPPFSTWVAWTSKLAEHGNGIALLPARTETRGFFSYIWPKASAICFIRGRVSFYTMGGIRSRHNCGFAICLVAFGKVARCRLQCCRFGRTVFL